MDKIRKFLNRLQAEERMAIKDILLKITGNDFTGLDLKKLKGRNDVFRVRKGKIRIIFRKTETISILAIERRSDNSYK